MRMMDSAAFVTVKRTKRAAITLREVPMTGVRPDYVIFLFGEPIGRMTFYPGVFGSHIGYESDWLPMHTGALWPMVGRHNISFIRQEIISINRQWAGKPSR